MKILAIETSCDETAIAVLEIKGRKNPSFEILSNVVSSQVKLHAKWGGVVPSLAKREHQKNLPLVLKRALKKAGFRNSKSQIPKIDLIAVVNGPGLEPALWTGINFAKELAHKWNKPLIPINHLEGHLFSVFLKQNSLAMTKTLTMSISGHRKTDNFEFPAVALLVSGGHTQLVLVKDWLKYKLLGETRDDAAGEAFDKVARMLNLGYPGGPAIASCAAEFQSGVFGRPLVLRRQKIELPRPMIHSKDYDFSFSGLKTAVLYKIKEFPKLTKKIKEEICAEFQQAVIDVLIFKTIWAAKEYKAKTIVLAGGVAANKELRKQMRKAVKQINLLFSQGQWSSEDKKLKLLMPELKFTGDNAAMIALAAYFRWQKSFGRLKTRKMPAKTRAIKKIGAKGNLPLTQS